MLFFILSNLQTNVFEIDFHKEINPSGVVQQLPQSMY